MSVNLKKKGISLKEIICSKYGQTKARSDLIVPDTKPDISKVLQICGKAVITQKTSQQDKAYVQGIVRLTIIYVPEGGGIKSIFTDLDFSHIIEAKGALPTSHIWAEAAVESTDCSIVNSRKLSLKCDVGIDAKICRTSAAHLPTGFDDDCLIQAKYKDYKISCSSAEEEQDFRFRERVEIPSGKPDICEIIKTDARCKPSDLRYSDGRINTAGDIELSVLYTDSEGLICSMEETLPFSETIEGMTLPEGECDASYFVKEINFDIEDTPEGARRFINIDILICGTFRTAENVEISAISDAFGTEKPIKLSKSTYEIESITDKSITQLAHKETVAVPDYLPEIYKICDCCGEARVTGISIEKGRINIDGEVASDIIYMSANEDCPVSGLSHISSFSQSIDMPYADNDSICEAKVELDHIGYNINSDRSIELRFIIILTVTILKSDTVEIIDDIEIDEECEKKKLPPAIIYFPEDGETVWDIAKRYMATPESIISSNSLESEELHKGQKICIFR